MILPLLCQILLLMYIKGNRKRKLKPQPQSNSQFRINITVVTICLVILGSIVSGIATAIIAYQLGRQSLSTVTTPADNPSKKMVQDKPQKTLQEFKIINEKEILVKVYDFVYQQKQENKAQPSS